VGTAGWQRGSGSILLPTGKAEGNTKVTGEHQRRSSHSKRFDNTIARLEENVGRKRERDRRERKKKEGPRGGCRIK